MANFNSTGYKGLQPKPETINDKGIYIYNANTKGQYRLITKHSIFSNDVYFKKTEDSITFFIAGMDYKGKTVRGNKTPQGSYTVSGNRIDLKPGYYPLDEEESNEDQAVFLLKLNEE